jgi:succinoglycan biosynthesis transport protein ExoP
MPEMEESQSFDLAQIRQFLGRRRWWILLTACVTTLATVGVVKMLPNRYTSEATVLVIQQQVPERYVTPTTTTDVSEALQGMTQEVLSRDRLLSIIDAVGLYPKERGRLAPEQLLENMRGDIIIQPLEASPERRNVNAFKISFVGDTPERAQEVTGRLTQLFIQENIKMREHQATVTTDFLQEHLAGVKKELTEQEARVQAYKMQHLGELPEQQAGNVSILASLSAQLQNTEAALSRAQEQKVYLEGLLRGYQDLASRDTGVVIGPAGEIKSSPSADLEVELAHQQAAKDALLSKYTPDHPDVVKLNAEIKRTEALLARTKTAALPQAQRQKISVPLVSSPRKEDAPMAQVKSQLEANRVEIANLTKDAGQLKEAVARYQERLNATPVREQQLAGMLRDYELLKQNYGDLLKKQLDSGLAVSLERHQEGQQFRVVDSASLPSVPSSPKRLKISLGGGAGGLALGLALAFFVEITEGSFHSEKQLRSRLKIPLVIAVPVLLTHREQRRAKWNRALGWVASIALIIMVLASEFYVYRTG